MHGLLSLQPNVLECCALFYCFLRGGLPSPRDRWLLQANRIPGACLPARVCRRSLGQYMQTGSSLFPSASSLSLRVCRRATMGTAIAGNDHSS
jgi:hypothetical protein